MFISTYSSLSASKNPENMAFKAIDIENRVEIFEIGDYYGDERESAKIYAISALGETIPFFLKYKTIEHCKLDLREINPNRYPRSGEVLVRVVSVFVSELGVDLKQKYPPVRNKEDTTSYIGGFSECRGYKFKSGEKSKILGYINEALPKIKFDYFETSYTPHPTICIAVNSDDEDISEINPDVTVELAKTTIDRIRKRIEYPEVLENIEKYLEFGSDRLELLLADVINVEREFFLNGYIGGIHFPQPIIQNREVWKVLRVIYEEDYSAKFESFESFLVRLVYIFNVRGHEKVIFEKYSGWKPA